MATAATASDTASGCMASLTWRVAAAWSDTNTGPPVPSSSWRPRLSMAAARASMSTPGSASMYAPSKFHSARGTMAASGAVATMEPEAFRSPSGMTSS